MQDVVHPQYGLDGLLSSVQTKKTQKGGTCCLKNIHVFWDSAVDLVSRPVVFEGQVHLSLQAAVLLWCFHSRGHGGGGKKRVSVSLAGQKIAHRH